MDKLVKYLPAALFCAYFMKVGILGGSLVDAAILVIPALMHLAMELKADNKSLLAQDEKLAAIQAQISVQAEEIDKLRGYVTSAKLNSLRTGTSAR